MQVCSRAAAAVTSQIEERISRLIWLQTNFSYTTAFTAVLGADISNVSSAAAAHMGYGTVTKPKTGCSALQYQAGNTKQQRRAPALWTSMQDASNERLVWHLTGKFHNTRPI